MGDIEEKRVYGARAGKRDLLVAAGMGVLAVEVSGDRVGSFGVARRCAPAAVAADDGAVAVATDEDVLLRSPGAERFEGTGFGPAVAVGLTAASVVAADAGGRLARLDARAEDGAVADRSDEGPTARTWTDVGRLDAGVRAIDGGLLAASDGVYRLPGLDYVGLDDVADVAAAGPLAATGDGLYSLGNGWMDERDGPFEAIASDGVRAHAVGAGSLVEREADGAWRDVTLPVASPVVDVAYGDVAYAVTVDGTLLARSGDGWRATPLGVEDVVGCAVA